MKNFKRHWKLAGISLAFFGLVLPSRAVDLTRFTTLFHQNKDDEDPALRFQRLEKLRSEAQASLANLMKQRSNIEFDLRYAELLLQRARDLEQFALELSLVNKNKDSEELRKNSQNFFKEGLARHAKLLARAKGHPMAPKIYLGMGRTELGLRKVNAAAVDAENGLQALRDVKGRAGAEWKHVELQLWLLRGDASFDLSRASVALDSYTHALQLVDEGSLEEAYGTYRIAWVHYNLKDPEKALGYLEKLITLSRDKFALKQEAVQDYALFMADLSPENFEARGSVAGLFKKLSAVTDDVAVVRAIERMGKTFAKNGRRREASSCYEFVIKQMPRDPANVDRALTIVEWTHSLADKDKLVAKYLWLLSDFGPKSRWYAAQSLSPDVQKLAYDKVEVSMRKFAVGLHQEAMKVQQEDVRKKTEAVVAQLYDEHLAAFSEAPRIHYYRAEIHRRLKEWSAAGERYDSYVRLLDTIPKNDWEEIDKKLRDDAAWSSVQVWAKAAEADPKQAFNFLASADRFLELYPKHPQAAEVALDAAKVELKSSSKAVALKRLHVLIKNYPRDPATLQAVHAGLDLLNKDGDFVNLALEARAWLESADVWAPVNEKAKISQELNKILAQTEAKACEVLGQQKDREIEAALCLQSFAKGFSKDPLAPKALLMSAEIFDRRKDSAAALDSLERLVKDYPDSEFAPSGLSRLASTYERAFQFEKASEVYENLLAGKAEIADREKITLRHLALLQSLGFEAKLKLALANKRTSDSIRRQFEKNRLAYLFEALDQEERRMGYDDKGLRSVSGQQFFAELEALRNKRGFELAQELNYRRIKGALWRARKQLDKADEEWMAGLKHFWKASGKDPEVWHAAARIRLEQASIWETVYKKIDLQKSPARKVELFQKLENWYAEILSMKSPVVALDALWASAQLYTGLAEEMKKSPETAPKAVDFEQKSFEIVRQIARKARDWKVLSPVAIASLQVLRKEKVAGNEGASPRFPWVESPRWMDLSAEQAGWQEWAWSGKDLRSAYDKPLNKIKNRSEARRAVFVSLARENSLKNKNLEAWVQSFNDQAGIQLRLQAMVQDGDLARAQLFAEQYENFFGQDAFLDFAQGRIDWARGNYLAAYNRWMNNRHGEDFKIAYLQAGWNSVFEELTEGSLSSSYKKDIFSRLEKLAKLDWQKEALLSLCAQGTAECGGAWSAANRVSLHKVSLDAPLARDFVDGQSAWSFKYAATRNEIRRGLTTIKNYTELQPLRDVLSEFYSLQQSTDYRGNDVYKEYKEMKALIDAKQSELDSVSKQRAIAGRQ